MRAYTPADQKAVKAAALSYRANPEFNTYDVLSELGTGEALVSVLDEEGIPTVVERTKILPPQSRMGTIGDDTRAGFITASELYEKYNETVDRDSAYEFLERYRIEMNAEAEKKAQQEAEEKQAEKEKKAAEKAAAAAEKKKQAVTRSVVNSTAGTIGRELGKSVGSLFGTFGKRVGGNIGASLGRGVAGTLFKK